MMRGAIDGCGASALVGTADPVLAAYADIVVFLHGGRPVDVMAGATASDQNTAQQSSNGWSRKVEASKPMAPISGKPGVPGGPR